MRRWLSGLVVVAVLVLAAAWLLRGVRGGRVSPMEPAVRASPAPRASRTASAAAPQRPSAGLSLRGTVVDVHGTPVAGARVSASWPEPGQTLSGLPCPGEALESLRASGPRPLSECMLDASGFVLELVGAREGEAPVYAEATTGADGTFLLEALPEGPLALWALSEHGAVMRPGIPAGTEGVQLVLREGLVLEGTVVGEGAPVPGATVTLLCASHTRFFDATTDAEGRFRVGPLPSETYFAAVMKDGWLPTLDLIDTNEQELTLYRAGRLSGRVLSGGVPVPGTRVRVAPGNSVPGDSARGLTADEEGRFSLELPVGAHSLSASREGRYALAHVTVGSTPADVVLELGSALHVEGTVSDDSGRPVAGARLELSPQTAYGADLSAVTGADGRYRAGPVEPGVWFFRVDAPGYLDLGEEPKRTLDASMKPVDLTLTRAASVTGLVTDAEGQPLPGIELSLVRPGPPSAPDDSETLDSTETDAEGRFILDTEEAGDYRIDIQDAPFLRAAAPVHAPSSGVHLTLRAGASVEGTVVDSRGLPLQDFFVELQRPEGREELYLRRYDSTDARGHFLLQGVEPGRYLLLASDNASDLTHRAWREVELRDGERTQVELRMEPERTLSALVVDGAGQPVASAFVRAYPPQEDVPAWKVEGRDSHHGAPAGVRSGADGRVTLRGLTEALYDVSVLKSGYTLDTGRSTGGAAGKDGDSVRVGAGTAEVRLVLKREAHVIGRVVDPEGAPVRRFNVNNQPTEDANGAFAVPLEPRGDWLAIEAEGLAPLTHRLRPAQGGADVDLGVLRLRRGRTLRGRVVDAETSEPLPQAHLDFATRPGSADESPLRWSSAGSVGRDGTFELHNVDLESFTVTVGCSGYLDQQLTVSPEQEELTVRLDSGARVEVTVTDRDGRPRTARVHFRGEAGGDTALAEKGLLVQRGLAPGTYTVRVVPERYGDRRFPVFLPQRVVVPASGRVQVRFEPQEGGTTVKLRVAGGTDSSVALIPGSVPTLSRFRDIDRAFVQSLPGQRTGDETTFLHVPAGRATVFVIDPEDISRFHREELDVPASGTVSRELTPVWQVLSLGED